MLGQAAFLNREEEASSLLAHLRRICPRPDVCIIHAPSGLGKSSLTRHVSRQSDASVVIRVEPLKHASAASETFYYVNLLARATAETLAKSAPTRSFEKFITKKVDGIFLDALTSDLEGFARKLFVPINTLKSLIRRAKKSSVTEKISNGFELKSEIDLIFNYLEFALDASGYVFVLENIQNIDLRSYEALLMLLERQNAHKWLLEYTDPKDREELHTMSVERNLLGADLRRVGVEVTSFRLEKLPAKYVAQMIRQSGDPAQIVLNSYLESDGNLRPLVDLEFHTLAMDYDSAPERAEKNVVIDLATITERRIETLSTAERLLLFVVHVLDGKCEITAIRELVSAATGPLSLVNLDTGLAELKRQKLVRIEGHEVRIAHDRVADAVSKIGERGGLMVSAKTEIGRYLETTLESTGSAGSTPQTAAKLCSIYLDTGEAERVSILLRSLTPDLVATGRTDRLVALLRDVEVRLGAHNLDSAFTDELFRQLVTVYYYAGKYEDALRCAKILQHNVYRTLLLSALYDLNSQHERALQTLKNSDLTYSNADIGIDLTARLIEITALRSLNRHDECLSKYRDLLKDRNLKDHPDYAFVLRGAEMVLPFREAEPLIARSIDALERQNRNVEAGRAAVICAFVQTILEKFDLAQATLRHASELLKGSMSERQALLNNHAALALYLGDFGPAVEEMLRRARLSAQPHYDRLVLLNNTMIFHAMRDGRDAASWAAESLEALLETALVSDKDIRRIIHFNLAQYWKTDDAQRSQFHLGRSKANRIAYLSEIWNRRWADSDWTNPRYRGSGTMPFIPTFLSYWTVDVPKLVEKTR